MSLLTPNQPIETGFDYTVSIPATSRIVEPQDIKDNMIFPDTDLQDPILSRLINSVVAKFEKECNLTIETKTYTAYWKTVGWVLPLPFPPIITVTSATFISAYDGSETALTENTEYWIEGVKNKKIHFMTLPIGIGFDHGLKVVYSAGLTDYNDKELAKEAIITECTEWFDNRGNTTDVQLYKLSNTAKNKIRSLMNW